MAIAGNSGRAGSSVRAARGASSVRGASGPGRPSRLEQSWRSALDRLASSGPAQRIWSFYQARSRQDQRALVLLGLVLLALLVGYGLLWPLQQRADAARASYLQMQEDLAWMQANRHRIVPATSRAPGQSLLRLATQSATSHGLTIRRFEPVGEGGVSLVLDQVEFDRAVGWLAELMRSGVVVEEFSALRKPQPGMTDLRIMLRDR